MLPPVDVRLTRDRHRRRATGPGAARPSRVTRRRSWPSKSRLRNSTRSPRRSASARASPSARASCRCRSCSRPSSSRIARSCRRTAPRPAQERGPAGRVHVDLPDLEPLGQRAPRVRQLLAALARVRRDRVPAARPHLLLGAARQGAPDHHGQGGAEGDRQGGEGAGGLHGRDPAHDRQRLVRHQRHRARHRLAAAPLAGRVLRARPRQDALVRQAAVLGARDSLPRLLARLRVRPEGLPVLPRRPPPQDAGDDAAEGDRAVERGHPAPVLRLRHLPPVDQGRRARVRSRAPARRDGALRRRRQGRQGRRRARQAHHRQAHPRARRQRREEDRRSDRLRPRARARDQHRRHDDRRGPGQGQRRDHRGSAREARRGRREVAADDLHQRPRPGRVHLADAAERRHARPDGRQGRDLPDDAPGRAADRGRGRGAVPRPVLLRGALRPVGGRPDEVQPPRRPQRAEGHRAR